MKGKLTEIEKLFLTVLHADMEKFPRRFSADKCLPWIREMVKATAYHEAGHFAARCFTQLEFSHVQRISILPDMKTQGRVTSERNFTAHSLASYPPPLQRSNGRMLLLMNFAGTGAEIIVSGEFESILECWDCLAEFDDNYDDETTDYFKARRIAGIMARPGYPAHQILNLAEKWTLEMLRIPAVWNVVETVGNALIERGEISDDDLYDMTESFGCPTCFHIPKWRRRLLTKPGEMDPYIEKEF